MLKIVPTDVSDITKVVCPHCRERVPRIGIKKNSRIDGLTFRCRKCGKLWEIITE